MNKKIRKIFSKHISMLDKPVELSTMSASVGDECTKSLPEVDKQSDKIKNTNHIILVWVLSLEKK